MSKSIKFRVWDVKNQSFIHEEDAKHKRLAISFDGRIYHGGWDSVLPENDYVINQWSGIKDKHGREIYEGDIVSFQHFSGEDSPKTTIEEVYFSEGMFLFGRGLEFAMNDVNFGDETLDILGNIYENPELLAKHD